MASWDRRLFLLLFDVRLLGTGMSGFRFYVFIVCRFATLRCYRSNRRLRKYGHTGVPRRRALTTSPVQLGTATGAQAATAFTAQRPEGQGEQRLLTDV